MCFITFLKKVIIKSWYGWKVADADVESATWGTHDELDWKLHSDAREGSNKKQKTIH